MYSKPFVLGTLLFVGSFAAGCCAIITGWSVDKSQGREESSAFGLSKEQIPPPQIALIQRRTAVSRDIIEGGNDRRRRLWMDSKNSTLQCRGTIGRMEVIEEMNGVEAQWQEELMLIPDIPQQTIRQINAEKVFYYPKSSRATVEQLHWKQFLANGEVFPAKPVEILEDGECDALEVTSLDGKLEWHMRGLHFEGKKWSEF